jgi:lambda repressor-like predicted transcriptional regulator
MMERRYQMSQTRSRRVTKEDIFIFRRMKKLGKSVEQISEETGFSTHTIYTYLSESGTDPKYQWPEWYEWDKMHEHFMQFKKECERKKKQSKGA